MTDLREKIQDETAKAAIAARSGIIFLAPRVGKTAVGIKILQNWTNPKTLIIYPDAKIKKAWDDEFIRMDYHNPNIVFTTNRSLEKHVDEQFDVILSDECHLLSERNLESLQKLLETHTDHFGLTGTLSEGTKTELLWALKWPIIASYTQEEAIRDGIVADYCINILRVPLDNQRIIQYKNKRRTEKGQFRAYTQIINELESKGKDTFFLRLARMRIIQGSVSKMEATRKLLRQFKDERVLVFCGLVKIADQLGIPVQHSKSDGDELDRFSSGEGNHLAVVKMGNTGRTYKPLNKLIINYIDSNPENLQQKISRAMNLEFAGQIADIYLVCSTEEVEARWLEKALAPFDENKIKYI